jgi:hypothetical protein
MGVNSPPRCVFCLDKDMDYIGPVPRGSVFVWFEHEQTREKVVLYSRGGLGSWERQGHAGDDG